MVKKKIINIFSLFILFLGLCNFVGCKKDEEATNEFIPTTITFNQIVKLESSYEIKKVTSEDLQIIEVLDDKSLKGTKAGTTKITVETDKGTVSQNITVVDDLATNIPSQILCDDVLSLRVFTSSETRITNYTIDIANQSIISYHNGMLIPQTLGKTTINISYAAYNKTYEIEVIDEVRMEVATLLKTGEKETVTISNAQGKAMKDAELTSSNNEIIRVNSLNEIEALKEGTVTLTLKWHNMECSKTLTCVKKFNYEYQNIMKVSDTVTFKVTNNNTEFNDFDLTSSDKSIIDVNGKTLTALKEGKVTLSINLHNNYVDEIEIIVASMSVSVSNMMKRGGIQLITPKFNPTSYTETYEVVSDNTQVISVSDNKITALKPGTAKITVTTKSGFKETITITVEDVYYNITYNISDEDKALMPKGFMEQYSSFSIDDLPIELPILVRSDASFLGWKINDSSTKLDLDAMKTKISEGTNYDITLTAYWGLSRLDLSYETTQVVKVDDEIKIIVTPYMIASYIDATKLVWSSDDTSIATIQNGIVTGVSEGSTLINVYLEDNPNISSTIGVTVKGDLEEMSELLKQFVDNAPAEIIAKNITVYGYQFNYEYRLLGSVTNYLFEDLTINESIKVSTNMDNRPGTVTKKYYIVVHDTASTASTANALAHAKYVQDGGGGTSWHYSVGNDGIYHQMPDNEVAYHAGDGHDDSSKYVLNKTGVKGTNENPIVTITADGYYAIDGSKTTVLAPTYEGKILSTENINDMGIRVVIKDGYYYIGNTYYNTTYNKISNYGGNMNSIGMETMVNYGSDIYYTWQKTAKLVAHLMKTNNLTINDVKPHHFFSGKNCPETMRMNGMWDNFIKLVEFEYDMITKYEGYKVTFTSNNPDYINELGRVIKQDEKAKSVSYTITVSKDGKSESMTLWTVIPGSSQFTKITPLKNV